MSINIGAYPAKTAESTAGWDINIGVDSQDLFDAGAPVWGALPAGRSYLNGTTLTYDVACAGDATLTYQWYKNGASMGASYQDRILTIAAAAATDGGTYYCIATNSVASSTMIAAYLSVRSDVRNDYWTPNIGAGQRNPVASEFYTNIGAAPMNADEVAVKVSGTCVGQSAGDIGVLLRNQMISGTCAGAGDGSGAITRVVFMIGTCVGQGRAYSPGLIKVIALVGTCAATSAPSGVLDLWSAKSFVTNDTDFRIELAYDPDNLGILITRTNTQELTNDNIWYDLRTGGFYPETYQKDLRSYATLFYPHSIRGYRGTLVGGSDGYIHVFDKNSKNDYGLNVDESIDSYFYSPPIQLGETDDMEGKLTSLMIYLGGSSLGADAVASDGIEYSIFVGDSIEQCYKKIKDGDTPTESGTVTVAGRSVRQRTKVRGAYSVLYMFNDNRSETWALNKVLGTVTPAGRIR